MSGAHVVSSQCHHRSSRHGALTSTVTVSRIALRRPVESIADHAASRDTDVGQGGVVGAGEGAGPEERAEGAVVSVLQYRWCCSASCVEGVVQD